MTEKQMKERLDQINEQIINKVKAIAAEEPTQTFTVKVPVKEYYVYQREYTIKASSEAEALMKFHEYWDAGWSEQNAMTDVEDTDIYEELYQHDESGEIVDVDDIEVCVECDGSEY